MLQQESVPCSPAVARDCKPGTLSGGRYVREGHQEASLQTQIHEAPE